MCLLHLTGDDLVRVLVGGQLWLAIHDTLEIDAGQRLVHLYMASERVLQHARNGMLGRAQQVSLGEVDGNPLRDGVLGDYL